MKYKKGDFTEKRKESWQGVVDDMPNELLYQKYAVSNDFARMPKTIGIVEWKILGMILSKLDWKKDNTTGGEVKITCTLSELRKACGVSTKDTNYEWFKEKIINLSKASFVEFKTPRGDLMGYLLPLVESVTNSEFVAFEFTIMKKMLYHFQQLAYMYTIIELENVKNFKSRFSYVLYMYLLSWTEHNNVCDVKTTTMTTKQIKELFGLSESDYVRSTGKFDRNAFEKKTINIAVDEIQKNTNLKIQVTKVKKGHFVIYYEFKYSLRRKDLVQELLDYKTGAESYTYFGESKIIDKEVKNNLENKENQMTIDDYLEEEK